MVAGLPGEEKELVKNNRLSLEEAWDRVLSHENFMTNPDLDDMNDPDNSKFNYVYSGILANFTLADICGILQEIINEL